MAVAKRLVALFRYDIHDREFAVGNFFLDNQDIQFLFDHIDLQELATLHELHAQNDDADYVPEDAADCVDNYRRSLEIVGSVAADTIFPNRISLWPWVLTLEGSMLHAATPSKRSSDRSRRSK